MYPTQLSHKASRARIGTTLTRLGGFVNNEAVGDDSSSFRLERDFAGLRRELSGQRWVRVDLEAGYDAVSWICGLLAAVWMTR